MSIYSVFDEAVVDAEPALCTIAEADKGMRQFPAWDIKSDEEKETEILAASQVISDLDQFYGFRVDEDQPLEFPRQFGTSSDFDVLDGYNQTFTLRGQRRKVVQAMVVLMTYRLGQVLTGVDSASLGNESVNHRGAQIPHEVRGYLWPFIRR